MDSVSLSTRGQASLVNGRLTDEHDFLQQVAAVSGPSPALQNPVLGRVNQSMLESLGELADYFGYNRIIGHVYGALLLSPHPMSLKALVDHLAVSKATVSMTTRTLENMGMAREVWVRGDRKKHYVVEPDFWKILKDVLVSRKLREVNQALHVLEINADRLQEAVLNDGNARSR